MVLLYHTVPQVVHTAAEHLLGGLRAIACNSQHGGRIWAVRAVQWWRLVLSSIVGKFAARARWC